MSYYPINGPPPRFSRSAAQFLYFPARWAALTLTEHLCYDNTGHMITSPYAPVITNAFTHPATGLAYEVGGNPAAQAHACKDPWEKTLLFLSRSTGKGSKTTDN